MNEKIISLANQLIEELEKEGYSVKGNFLKGFGVFEHLDNVILCGHGDEKWLIEGKLTAKIGGGQPE